VVRGAEQRCLKLKAVEAFRSLTGQGAEATIEGRSVRVVSPGYLRAHDLTVKTHASTS
jgi:Cu2+-exporting ATPase